MGGQSAIKVRRKLGIVAALAALLAGCTSMPDDRFISLPIPKGTQQTAQREPATQREHARILASYGGTYENARLQAMIEKTVDRLVAASERPDLKYKVTILNSGIVDEIITGVQVSWPAANGNLVQVKLDGDVIYDNPDIAPPSAALTLAQLVADPNKRKIKHGESDVLMFIFQNNADPTLSNYTGTVDTSGFALTILP